MVSYTTSFLPSAATLPRLAAMVWRMANRGPWGEAVLLRISYTPMSAPP